ncbi:MAG TPA: MarC family protein [Myxococcales bacterium]|nr:MarC family protein [Myxococcales bacterium]
MRDLLSFSLLSLSAIFVVVDPLGAVPLFLSMTSRESQAEKARTARRAALATFWILTVFALAGTLIFRVFGVTLGSFKVAGGVLLLLTAFDMLRAQPTRTRTTPEEEQERAGDDIAIFPLAMPILAGPGSIATVLSLMGRAGHTLLVVPVILSIALTCVATWLMLRGGSHLEKILGVTRMNVLQRVSGLITSAIGVQFIFDGIKDAFPGLAGSQVG